MRLKHLLLTVILVLTLSTLFAGVMPPKDEFVKLDAKVDELMEAYNAKDAKAFFIGWSPTMAALCTPAMFKVMFMDMHMKNFGAFKTKQIIEAETVVMGNVPNALLVYQAEFEKNKNVKLSINLLKENGQWMIQQVSMQAIP